MGAAGDLSARMLALARSKALLQRAQYVRPLCAPAVDIATKLAESIETAKGIINSPKAASAYPLEQLNADIAKGSVDVMKIGEVFSGNEKMKKMAMGQASKSNELKKKIADMKTPTVNWDEWQVKFASMPGTIDKIKEHFEAESVKFNAELDKMEAEMVTKGKAELAKIYTGPNGLIAKAEAADKAEGAYRVELLAQLENLLHEAKNIETLTIAEILEKNPEWQKAIEEDLQNHNWAPEAPKSIAAAKLLLRRPTPRLRRSQSLRWTVEPESQRAREARGCRRVGRGHSGDLLHVPSRTAPSSPASAFLVS